jgi:site-specific DNA-methyltransferase (adenine-specific)
MDALQAVLNTIQNVDALTFLRTLPDSSFHSIITSPPYYAQRDYGSPHQIGLEDTPDEYIARLVEVFREARRVLRSDGTFWLNIGDNYVGATSQHKDGGSQGKTSRYSRKHMNGIPTTGRSKRNKTFYEMGLPMKSLVGMPWRVAFALQADGWILRSDIIWHRPSASESVKDRPTHAHEYVFMFAKSQHYYYDRSAMLTPTGANIQSVWKIGGSPFTGAHCAVFPPELIEPIVIASCPEDGIIFDPFGGSGTVGLVSRQHNRNFILCEISAENAKLSHQRIFVGITNNDRARLKGTHAVQRQLFALSDENGHKRHQRERSPIALSVQSTAVSKLAANPKRPKTSHRLSSGSASGRARRAARRRAG